jgi:hypothetical protein
MKILSLYSKKINLIIAMGLISTLIIGCNKCYFDEEDLKPKEKNIYKKEYDCNKLEGYHKFIYEPIIISSECNCIVSGKVKYLEDCETKALIDYGNGDCDNIATKIICKNGDCFDKFKNPFETYDFIIDCNGNTINDGPVDVEEVISLNDPSTGPQP